jgi:co-chaperonin GroES (HSP10)
MLTPVIHRIIVKQEKLEDVDPRYKQARAAGIVIPDHEDNKRAQAGVDKGTVVAIGPTAYVGFDTECPLKVGDVIAFARYSGKVVTDPDDNEEYVLLNDEDVVCIISKKDQ